MEDEDLAPFLLQSYHVTPHFLCVIRAHPFRSSTVKGERQLTAELSGGDEEDGDDGDCYKRKRDVGGVWSIERSEQRETDCVGGTREKGTT